MPNEAKVPTYDKLMWPVLKAIKALGGSATNDELLDKVIELEQIPDAVQNVMHTEHQTKLSYRLAWAKTYLGKAGALENPTHGVWATTEKGNALTAEEVEQIPVEVRKLYKIEKGKKPKDHQETEDLSPELKDWKDGLLAILTSQIKPDAFERLAQRILRESGFVKVEVTGRSGDGDIDGVGVLRLALLSFQVTFSARSTREAFRQVQFGIFAGRWLAAQIRACLLRPERSPPKQKRRLHVMGRQQLTSSTVILSAIF